MSSRAVAVVAFVAVAAVTAFATGAYAVSNDERRETTAQRLEVREADRDAVNQDVDRQEARIAEIAKSVGHDVKAVEGQQVELPEGVSENILTGKLAVADFEDVFIDEGIVLRGIRAREVDEIPLTLDEDGRKQPPLKPEQDGLRLLQVDIWITNRSGDGADPACGMTATLNGYAILDDGEYGTMLTSYDNVGTYPGACGAGLADGASGMVSLGVGMREGEKLKALRFQFLGEGESDKYSQVMVFEDPI